MNEERGPSQPPRLTGMDRWLGLYPMAAISIAAAVGIAITDSFESTHWHPGWAYAIAGMLALCAWRTRWRLALYLAATALFGGLHFSHLAQTRNHPLRKMLLAEGRPVAVTAMGQLIPEAADETRPTGLLVAERMAFSHKSAGQSTTPATLKLLLPDGFNDHAAQWECQGRLYLPSAPTIAGNFDRTEQLYRDGFVAVLKVDTMMKIGDPTVASIVSDRLHAWANHSRKWIASQLTLDLSVESPQAAIICGMVLGDAGAAGTAVEKTFRDSGTLHLFAVSGLHVGLIALVGWALLKWLPFHRSTNLILLILMVFGYAFVTGWRPSAARAAWMIALMLSAGLIGRRANLLNSLGVAATVLLATDTHQLFRPGFQLSFGVLTTIILAVPWIMQKATPWVELDSFLPRQLASPSQVGALWARRSVTSLTAVSLAAWAGSFPLMLWHFQSVAPIGAVANCFLVPLAFCALLTSCLSLSAALLHIGGVQIMLNNANWFFATIILQLTSGFSDAPGARWTVPNDNPSPAPAEGVFFDVPDGGSAAWMRIGPRHWLWDTGPRREFDFGIAPYLDRQGVRRLDGLILSHNDVNHVGGASEAIGRLDPKRILHGIHEPWPYDSGLTVLPSLLRNSMPSLPFRRVGRGDSIDLGRHVDLSATAEVLYPDVLDLRDRADDRSLAWKVRIGPWTMLLLADVGFSAEKQILETYRDLRADVLFHTLHADDPGCLPEFLQRVQPRLVMTTNEPSLPEEKVPTHWVKACESLGIPRWNTRDKGSIHWTLLPDGSLEFTTHRSNDTLRWFPVKLHSP